MPHNSIKWNLFYSILYQIIAIILPLITTPYVSRVLGAENLGIYSYNYTIASYFVAFAMLGLSNYGNREVAKAKNDRSRLNKVISGVFGFQLIHSFFIFILYICYSLFISSNLKGALCAGIYVFSAMIDVGWILNGLEEFKFITIRSAFIKVLAAICLFVFVKNSDDVYIYLSIICISTLVSNISALPIIHKEDVRLIRVSLHEIYSHAIPILLLFVPFLGISVYKYINKIILAHITSDYALGLFESSERLILVPIAFVTALGNVMLPRMSENYSLGRENAKYYINKSLALAVASTSLIAFVSMTVLQEFVPLFYGVGFDGCNSIITALMLSTPFLAIANVVRTQCLIPKSKDKEYVISIICGAVVDLLLVYFFIKSFGATGAAIAAAITESVVCIVQLWLSREEHIITIVLNSFGYVVCGFIMYLIVSHIRISDMPIVNLFMKAAIGTIIYALLGGLYYNFSNNKRIC